MGHSVTNDIKKESEQCPVAKLIIPSITALSVTIFIVYLHVNLQYENSLVQSLTNCRTYSCFVFVKKIIVFDHSQRKIIFIKAREYHSVTEFRKEAFVLKLNISLLI